MIVEQMSDRKLEMERLSFFYWIKFHSDEEEESGEVESWRNSLELIDAEIKRRHEQGSETR
jgi:hypothetical protein